VRIKGETVEKPKPLICDLIGKDREMINDSTVRLRLELGFAMLHMLKESCQGIYKARDFSPSRIWFKGAGIICDEIIERVEDALIVLEEIDRDREKETSAESGEGQKEIPTAQGE